MEEGVPGTGGIHHEDTPSPPLCRHPEVLPRHSHDAGVQARPLLQGLLAVSVPSHTPGNQGWEGRWLAGVPRSRAGPFAFSPAGLPQLCGSLYQGCAVSIRL